VTGAVVVVALVSAISGLLYGYDTGIISGALLQISDEFAIGVGILVATIVGATESVDWRLSIGAAVVPSALMLGLMLRLPDSPRWLVEAERTARTSGWRGLREPWVRPALVVGCGVAVFTQLSGIEMIVHYSPTILTDNGFSDSAALRMSVALGATYLITQLIGLAIIDRVGRRRLTLLTLPGAALALVVLGTFFVTGNSGEAQVPYIIATLIVFMAFTAGGIQLMGGLTGSAIYPLATREAGAADFAGSR
jgi:MFS family permease